MKNILIPDNLNSLENLIDDFDGFIVGLKDFALNTRVLIDLDTIFSLIKKYPLKEIYIYINKNMKDKDLKLLKPLLIKLNKLDINGVFVSDSGLLKLAKKIDFKKPLIWSQEHMVTNAKTINYWHDLGYSMAYLSNELTISEIQDIRKQTNIPLFCQVFGYIPMFVSKRFLVSNYKKHFNIDNNSDIYYMSKENIDHIVIENNDGTTVYYGKVLNAYLEYYTIKNMKIEYAIFNGTFLKDEIVKEAINCYKNKLGKDKIEWYLDYKTTTGFFNQDAIYRVKK